jgi:hypothetical protein
MGGDRVMSADGIDSTLYDQHAAGLRALRAERDLARAACAASEDQHREALLLQREIDALASEVESLRARIRLAASTRDLRWLEDQW